MKHPAETAQFNENMNNRISNFIQMFDNNERWITNKISTAKNDALMAAAEKKKEEDIVMLDIFGALSY